MSYRSLEQLRRGATAVAIIAPTGSAIVRHIGQIPFTIATVSVLKSILGTRLPSAIGLRQSGAVGVIADGGCDPLVSRGHNYLAHLTPHRLHPGAPGIGVQYRVVGGGRTV